MKVFTFYNEYVAKVDLDTIWNFFCHPSNLNLLTPSEFNLKSKNYGFSDSIYSGMLIEHQLVLFKLIKINWLSEIVHIKEKEYFIDKQIKGPFAFWQHEHRFEPKQNSTLIKDYVVYSLPLFGLNTLFNKLVITKKLQDLFSYRNKMIDKYFKGSL